MKQLAVIGAALLLGGCIESAEAQTAPRADSGARVRRPTTRLPSQASLLEVVRRAAVIRVSAGSAPDGDAGVSPRTRDALRELQGGPGGGGTGAPAAGLARLGSLTAGSTNYGGLGIRRLPYEAHFDQLRVTGPLTQDHIASGLRVASLHAARCLAAAHPTEPADVEVRFTVRTGAPLDGLTVPSAPEAVERCVRESLARASFTPGATPTEVSARLRGAARFAIGPARP